jgi:parallel beta-helix repeat protein
MINREGKMKKVILLIFVVDLFFFSADLFTQMDKTTSLPNGVAYPPSIVYVDDDYDENTPGWGYDHFDNIDDGVWKVRSYGTVYVYTGYYFELCSIIIYKPLALIGENRVSTIISNSVKSVVDIISHSVTVSNFTIQSSSGAGNSACVAISSDSCTITGNIITRSPSGYMKGIVLRDAEHNLIQGNVISNAYWGIQTCTWTQSNLIVDNLIIGNEIGVWICCSPGPDLFYHNNFIDNYDHAWVDWGVTDDTEWDNGYPAGGNFWDDYDGIDEFSGPAQNIPGSDGIGDSPRLIPEYDTQDDYPLMHPWIGPELFID